MSKLKLPRNPELPGGVQPHLGIKKGDIAKYVVVTNFVDTAKYVASRMSDAKKVPPRRKFWDFWEEEPHEIYTGRIGGVEASVCRMGWSSGQMSSTIEELINVGAKVIIYHGYTGAMQENIKIGDVEIITGGVRDEGTSRYYAPMQYPAVADYYVTDALVKAAEKLKIKYHIGIIRSTDGFYASQRIEEEVARWSGLGVLSVEQEVSALYTICGTRGVRAGSVQAVFGNLVTGRHIALGQDVDPCKKAEADAVSIELEGIKNLHERGY